MSDTLDWLCNEIGIKREKILSPSRDKKTVSKRHIIVLFFRLMGKSSVWLEQYLNRDHSSILHAEQVANDEERKRACELAKKYTQRILGEEIDELKIDNIRRKMTIRVPNYHTGAIEEKEIFVDEYKPKITKLNFRTRQKG